MKIVGLITEYNPLHNGHIHHLRQAKALSGAGAAVAVMSGDFVQRGCPAITDKYRRTRMALEAGVDLVLELPVRYAVGSAPGFAEGAVSILNSLNCVTDLVYGCEAGDSAPLREIAELLLREPPELSAGIRAGLRQGLSFPAAREAAIRALRPDLAELLRMPNNILGIEYEKALLKLNSGIRSRGLPRSGIGHHETGSAIRALLTGPAPSPETGQSLSDLLPETSLRCLDYCVLPEDFRELIAYRILMLSDAELLQYEDMTPELVSRIRRFGPDPEAARCRNYPAARVQRALLHALLGIRRDTPAPTFIRVLGLRRDSDVLKACRDSALPLVTKLADAPDDSWAPDARASDLYDLIAESRHGIKNPGEYLAGPVIL